MSYSQICPAYRRGCTVFTGPGPQRTADGWVLNVGPVSVSAQQAVSTVVCGLQYNGIVNFRSNKQLSYRRETALQGGLGLVMAKIGRLELGDNILRTLQVYLQPL